MRFPGHARARAARAPAAAAGAAAGAAGAGAAASAERARASAERGSELWLLETTLLLIVGLLLAIATINDDVRQVHINDRLIADVETWRSYTGRDYHNLSVDQRLLGENSGRDVVCGNTRPGPPRSSPQLCLAIWGSTVDGTRTVHGGWHLHAHLEFDVRSQRYGCFGEAGRGACP